MRQLHISIGVIKQNHTYLLQQRGDDPKIGAAGKIGAFGGKIEDGESPIAAICRELAEETSLQILPDEVNHIATYPITSDHRLEQVGVLVEAFEITVDSSKKITSKEGEIVQISQSNVMAMLERMTPATRYYFERVKGE